MTIHPFHHRFLITFAALALLGAMAGCGGDKKESSMTSFGGGTSSDTPHLFSVPKDQLAHLQIVDVQPAPLTRMLRLTGAVAFNGFDTTPVITQVGGPVSRIVVSPGQNVRRGEPLLYVTSPDYSQLRSTYLKALSTYQVADKEYARAQDLYQHHAIAEKDLLAAQAARVQAQADLQNTEQSLRILGVSKPETIVNRPPSPEVPLLAPIGGEVVERLCSPGQVIQSGATQCFTISNMSTVWVLANVYQNQLPYVHVGDPVTINTDAYQGLDFTGKISYISAALDPTTRTLQARIDVKNPGEKLKKDMYVDALVRAGTIPNAISVPDSSVLRDAENKPFVYVLAGQDQFARRDVEIGEAYQGRTQVTAGLQPGDRVVGDGSLFLQFANSFQQ